MSVNEWIVVIFLYPATGVIYAWLCGDIEIPVALSPKRWWALLDVAAWPLLVGVNFAWWLANLPVAVGKMLAGAFLKEE